MRIFLSLIVCAFLLVPIASAKNTVDPIIGYWYTEEREGVIEFYACDDKICGRFHWIRDEMENGDISRDTHNPDPDLRSRPLCGLQFMGDFKPKEGKYTDGWIYSPRHGANFSAEMKFIDYDTIELRGYMFFPFLGESQTWTRAQEPPECSSSQK